MRRLDKFDSMDINLRKLWETVKDRETWSAAFKGWTGPTERQQWKR